MDGQQHVMTSEDDPLQHLARSADAAMSAGNFRLAGEAFRKMLILAPGNASAFAGLGTVAGLQGEHGAAAEHFGAACALEPGNPFYLHNYGEALRQLGRNHDAEVNFRKVIALAPGFIPAYDSLIPLLQAAHRQALQRTDAVRSGALARELAILSSNQGNAWLDAHDLKQALECYRRSIAVDQGYVTAWSNLANALRSAGKNCEAEEAGRKAIGLDPGFAPAWNNLGNALAEQGRLDEASACFDRALALKPDFPAARHNRGGGMLMNHLYDPEISEESLFGLHCRWGEGYPAPALSTAIPISSAGTRLRVGYLSPDFRTHAMLHFLEPILAHQDTALFDVTCYAEGPANDEQTKRLQSYGHSWVWTHTLDDAALRERIAGDRIDILVDCAGHTQGGRLEALSAKPAPVMLSWMGYLGTTGLPAMEYRLTDAWADPPGLTESLHTEQLLRIPGGMMSYRPHVASPEVSGLPLLRNGFVTFGSLNNVRKMNAVVAALWARVLHAVPGSRLLLQSGHLADAGTVGRMRGMFEAFGIHADRLDLRPSSTDFLLTYSEIDIALDPMPYGGGVTTCDSLWMGVPVVTLSGSRPAGRLSASILHQIGRSEWIASDRDGYIGILAGLAADADRLSGIRAGLRPAMTASPLCNEAGFVRRLEQVYRELIC